VEDSGQFIVSIFMLVKLRKVCSTGGTSVERCYFLKEVWINPSQVVTMEENFNYREKNRYHSLVKDLDSGHSFTSIVLSAGEQIVVVGSVSDISSKLLRTKKTLLRG